MIITLRPEQEDWLREVVAIGDFPSVEDAARHLIDERIAERELERIDDLTWAKPAVDQAFAALKRGEVVSADEHLESIAERLSALKK